MVSIIYFSDDITLFSFSFLVLAIRCPIFDQEKQQSDANMTSNYFLQSSNVNEHDVPSMTVDLTTVRNENQYETSADMKDNDAGDDDDDDDDDDSQTITGSDTDDSDYQTPPTSEPEDNDTVDAKKEHP